MGNLFINAPRLYAVAVEWVVSCLIYFKKYRTKCLHYVELSSIMVSRVEGKAQDLKRNR